MDQTQHRQLVSGISSGLAANAQRAGLSVLAWGYGAAVRLRNLMFRLGWLKSTRVSVPVISIGNLTAGGTGKTPFAAYVAEWFRQADVRVAFLSRGFGADPGAVNDEALVLDQLCPDVPHIQNPDRLEGARIAIEELETQLLVLDDGFQHRRIQRDLDLVLIDATNPWGYNALLPRGYLREPLSALQRADCVVVTRVDQVAPEQLAAIRAKLQRVRGTSDCIEVSFPAPYLINAKGETFPWEDVLLRGMPTSKQAIPTIAAFCGIGNPEAFRKTLHQHNCHPDGEHFQIFPDHHTYNHDDVAGLVAWVAHLKPSAIITTQKDLVKLELMELAGTPLYAAAIETHIQSGHESLEQKFESIRRAIPPDPTDDE